MAPPIPEKLEEHNSDEGEQKGVSSQGEVYGAPHGDHAQVTKQEACYKRLGPNQRTKQLLTLY